MQSQTLLLKERRELRCHQFLTAGKWNVYIPLKDMPRSFLATWWAKICYRSLLPWQYIGCKSVRDQEPGNKLSSSVSTDWRGWHWEGSEIEWSTMRPGLTNSFRVQGDPIALERVMEGGFEFCSCGRQEVISSCYALWEGFPSDNNLSTPHMPSHTPLLLALLKNIGIVAVQTGWARVISQCCSSRKKVRSVKKFLSYTEEIFSYQNFSPLV